MLAKRELTSKQYPLILDLNGAYLGFTKVFSDEYLDYPCGDCKFIELPKDAAENEDLDYVYNLGYSVEYLQRDSDELTYSILYKNKDSKSYMMLFDGGFALTLHKSNIVRKTSNWDVEMISDSEIADEDWEPVLPGNAFEHHVLNILRTLGSDDYPWGLETKVAVVIRNYSCITDVKLPYLGGLDGDIPKPLKEGFLYKLNSGEGFLYRLDDHIVVLDDYMTPLWYEEPTDFEYLHCNRPRQIVGNRNHTLSDDAVKEIKELVRLANERS